MRNLIFTLFFTTCSVASFAVTDTSSVRKNADSLRIEKKYKEAIQLYTDLLNIDSTRGDLYVKRGNTRTWLDLYQDAYNDMSKALALQPDNPEYYIERGRLLMNINIQDDAISDFSTGLIFAKDPLLKIRLYSFRADARNYKMDYEGALSDAGIILAVDSINVYALTGILNYLCELKRDSDALVYGYRALRHYPDNPGIVNNMALIYSDMGEYSKAIVLYDRSISLDTTDPAYAYNNRGYAKYKLNNLDSALADINKSLSLLPENSYALKNRALVYIAMNKIDLACKDLKDADKMAFKSMYGDEVGTLMEKYCK